MLPSDLVHLIKSFLPAPKPFVPKYNPYYFLDYMETDNWTDVSDVRCYGDY